MPNENSNKFARIFELASRARNPLLIAGIALLALYAVTLKVLERLQFGVLSSQASASVVQKILSYVFIIALVTIVLSVVAYLLPKIVPKSLFIPAPRLGYGVVVFRLFDPLASPVAQLMQRIELFPGFPYYSRESDHPSYWPPRVYADRQKLHQLLVEFFDDPDLKERLKKDPSFKEDAVQLLGGGPGRTREREFDQYISSARSHLLEVAQDQQALMNLLGPDLFRRFQQVEQTREGLREWFPNRLAVVRVRNAANRDVNDLGVELEIAGAVYDHKIIADPEKVQNSSWEADAHRVTFERLPSGYTAEIRIWYLYQSVSERAFPDKIDIINDLTQGIRIVNIAGRRTDVRYDERLIKDLTGYDRLYIGDARKKDDYDQEIAAFQEKAAQETLEHMENYDKTHPTLKNISLAELEALDVPDNMIDSIWLAFRSPNGRQFDAVHVFKHPKGPYVLLSNKDLNNAELLAVQSRLANIYQGKADSEVTNRSDDICTTIEVEHGFTKASIAAATALLARDGYTELTFSQVHYHTEES